MLSSLVEDRRAVVTPYDLFQFIRRLFCAENRKQLYLRHDKADTEDLRKVVSNLFKTRALEVDQDYGRSVYRVLTVGESSADEVTALANPFGHISHISAMQRWGLTERRPEALYLTIPSANTASALIEERMAKDYGSLDSLRSVKMRLIRHPNVVRGRALSVHETRRPTQWIQVQNSYARLATIGQAFVDTVERPQHCGGMAHVMDVWRAHAAVFLEEIISTVDKIGTPIAKVRAGYFLDEMLGIGNDQRVVAWAQFAQRGSSRVLDPTKEFGPIYSEKWMLSINV